MPRNTTGGKNFKKFKTGSEGFRAKAAREAAEELLDLLKAAKRIGKENISPSDQEALRYMFAGRVLRRFGHGRMEVYCHDGVTRQCRIRGLLRKKGQVFIDIDSHVVVSLRQAEDSTDSDDDTGVKGGSDVADGTADIVGLFDEKQRNQLSKLGVNPKLFATVDAGGELIEDIFDRGDGNEIEEEGDEEDDKVTKARGKSKKGEVRSSVKAAALDGGGSDVDIDNI
jgi:translation initiation factor IF-1